MHTHTPFLLESLLLRADQTREQVVLVEVIMDHFSSSSQADFCSCSLLYLRILSLPLTSLPPPPTPYFSPWRNPIVPQSLTPSSPFSHPTL